jgi:hypothetical protein
MFWHSALDQQVKAILLYENNQMADGTERYIYYDLKSGHMFDLHYTKKG